VLRVAKMHRMPYLDGTFSKKKSTVVSGSFAERDLEFKASYESLPHCVQMNVCVYRVAKMHRMPDLYGSFLEKRAPHLMALLMKETYNSIFSRGYRVAKTDRMH